MREVKVSREDLEWLVWLEDKMVARFFVCGDALAYAGLLECSPTTRREALEAGIELELDASRPAN